MSMPTVELSEVADFGTGGTPSKKKPEYYVGDIPWITGADIEATGAIVTSARSHITPEAVKNSATNVVDTGTVLLVTRTSVGKVGIAGMPLAINQDITAIRPDSARLDRNYLVRCLQRQVRRLEDRAQGATIQGVNRAVVAETLIPLPPIEEQRRIAAVLDTADALRAKRREALAKLDTLAQAIFIDMFGEPAAGGTPLVPLKKVVGAPITRGIDQPGPDVEGGVPYLKTTDFRGLSPRREALARSSHEVAAGFPRSVVRVGDSVICIRATVGPTLFITEELDGVNLSRGTARVSPSNDVLPKFLFTAIRSVHFQRQIEAKLRGATFLQIPLKELQQLEIQLPSMREQGRLVEAVDAIESQVAAVRCSLASLDDLFASLQQRAFRGEL